MLFQSCRMGGQVNNQPTSGSPHNSDWDSGPDEAGIYNTSDPTHIVHCMRRISAHLRRINESLESLDSELVNYRTCFKDKLLGKPNITGDSATRLWWYREIQNELKVFHFYASFCMKFLCKDFCLEQHSVDGEEV